jgi:hypothetical protein
MPMEETPLEQLVVELATKWTGEESVLLLAGEETDTPANEHAENDSKQRRILISCSSSTILGGAEQILDGGKEKTAAHAKQNFGTL